MHPKVHPVAIFFAMSFLLPLGEVIVLRRIEPFGKSALIEGVLMAAVIYWWYYLDKTERGFRAGTLQNISVVVLSVIALPIYLLRSRGWKQGAIATIVWIVVLILSAALGFAGERIGASIASYKSLERTVSHRGRTVRALAVGARGGVEWQLWPAVQRNR